MRIQIHKALLRKPQIGLIPKSGFGVLILVLFRVCQRADFKANGFLVVLPCADPETAGFVTKSEHRRPNQTFEPKLGGAFLN